MSLKIVVNTINENQKYLSREELLERVLYFRKDKENEFIYFVSDNKLFVVDTYTGEIRPSVLKSEFLNTTKFYEAPVGTSFTVTQK